SIRLSKRSIRSIYTFHRNSLRLSYGLHSIFGLTRLRAIGIAKRVSEPAATRRRYYVPRLYPPVTWLFACIVLLAAARAQSTFGSIRGTVQDASGAVIPGALVTVHSLDENFDRQATSDGAGN